MLGRRFALVLAAMLAAATPVLAQPAADSSRALTLGHEGLDLYNKGNWSEARVKFSEADRLAHSPVFVLYLARCARNAGDLAASKQAYERVAGESVPAGSPAPWVAAVASAKKELEELEKKLAELEAAASANPSGTASVPVPTATLAPTSPGPTAAPTGTLAPTSTAPGPTARATAAPTVTLPPQGEPGSLAPGLAAVAVGAAGVGVGIGLFAQAKSIADGVLSRCVGDLCKTDDIPNKNSAVDLAQGATIALIGGGVALGAGVVLLLVRPGGKPAAPQKGSLRITPGFASVQMSGSF